MSRVALRPVDSGDLDRFFAHLQDPEAVWMAAFTPPDPSDREAFDAHWARLFADDTVLSRSILLDGEVVGHVASFEMLGDREVTYWIDRSVWGRGVATEALMQFVSIETLRPLHARAAADNARSIRVLEKCGFRQIGADRGFATARDEEIDEAILQLR